MEDSAPKTAHDALDATAHIEGEIEVFHSLQREAGDPLAELRRDLPSGLVEQIILDEGRSDLAGYPLDDAPIDADAKRLHQIIGEGRAALPRDVRDAERRVESDPEDFLQNGGE